MNMDIKIHLSAILLIFVISGCSSGSDSDDDANVDTCREVTSCPSGGTLGGFLEWISGACTIRTVCSSDQVKNSWELGTLEETEPNDSLQQALPVFVEAYVFGEVELPQVNISGSVSPTDVADYIAFSTAYGPDSGGVINAPLVVKIFICKTPNSCVTPYYSGDAAYLDVLDANGSVIASTAVSLGPGGHEIIMSYTPELVYFVRIVKDNLTAGEFEYRVVLQSQGTL